jgi:hypothetical protein
VHPRDFGYLVPYSEDRVERRHRLLEDHRDAVAADGAHLRWRELEQILPLELDAASGLDPARRLDQPKDGERRDRLAAARLANESDSLAWLDRERHSIDGPGHSAARVEAYAQIRRGKKGHRHDGGS